MYKTLNLDNMKIHLPSWALRWNYTLTLGQDVKAVMLKKIGINSLKKGIP
jgi:hypothetical protein